MKRTIEMKPVSAVWGAIQVNGIQPVTLTFAGVDSRLAIAVTTDMADELARANGSLFVTLSDSAPVSAEPAPAEPAPITAEPAPAEPAPITAEPAPAEPAPITAEPAPEPV